MIDGIMCVMNLCPRFVVILVVIPFLRAVPRVSTGRLMRLLTVKTRGMPACSRWLIVTKLCVLIVIFVILVPTCLLPGACLIVYSMWLKALGGSVVLLVFLSRVISLLVAGLSCMMWAPRWTVVQCPCSCRLSGPIRLGLVFGTSRLRSLIMAMWSLSVLHM